MSALDEVGRGLCVYDWSKWRGFMVPTMFPAAHRLEARWAEAPTRIVDRVPADANTLLLHLDISINTGFLPQLAELREKLAARGVELINAGVVDIRKRSLQAKCRAMGLPSVSASRDGLGDEALIVKTDLNAGGYREKRLSRSQRRESQLPEGRGLMRRRRDYFVARRDQISDRVWADPSVVVERYIVNRRQRFFRAYVAGAAAVISEAICDEPIKRMEEPRDRRNYYMTRSGSRWTAAPNESALPEARLIEVAATFMTGYAVDFGAADIVQNDEGECFVVDLTTTPFWGDEVQPGMLEHLRSIGLR